MDIHDNSSYSFLGRKLAFTFGQDFRYPFNTRTDLSAGADRRIRTQKGIKP